MDCALIPLYSGSKGNATFISMGGEQLLVDCGVSGAAMADAFGQAQIDPHKLAGIFVTHEHTDHISGVGVLSRRYDLPIFATEGTWEIMQKKVGKIRPENIRILRPGQDFYLGALDIMPFAIPHDAAEPVGYSFRFRDAKLCVATDLGCIKDEWLDELKGADAVLLESNHDPDMVSACRYTYDLKKRILGRRGHLSNEDAGKAAVQLASQGVRHIILGHLSEENNFPELAWQTVNGALLEAGYEDVALEIARQRKSGKENAACRM